MLQQKIRLARLRTLYGSLLSKRQLKALSLHLDQDLSLKEISERMRISRQGVHDLIKRAEKTMERWEAKLLLLKLMAELKDALPRPLPQKFRLLRTLEGLFIV